MLHATSTKFLECVLALRAISYLYIDGSLHTCPYDPFLRADIVRCQELHQRLLKSNPKFDKVHFVTYREQRLIWEYLGDP